jgi:hypothetical protein
MHFFSEASESGWQHRTGEKLSRLGLEGHQHGRQLQALGLQLQMINQPLVATVHAIEVADGQYTAFVPRPQIVQSRDNFHNPSIGVFRSLEATDSLQSRTLITQMTGPQPKQK